MLLGFDVGGTKTEAVAVDPDGRVVGRARRATGVGNDGVLATLTGLIEELAGSLGFAQADVASVGVGVPGQVEPGSGVIIHAVNLGVERLDLARALGAHLPVRVRVENDVNAAAVGASALHGCAGSMAYLNLGTGVAAGIVHRGQLWRGAHGTAGEVGHMSVAPDGPACRCGQRGCVEAFTGGGAVARRWGRPGEYPVRDVFDAADAGDAHARTLRGEVVGGVAAAVRLLVLTLDVDEVVLGGGVSQLGDRLLAPVVERIARDAAASPFLASLDLGGRLRVLPAGSAAGALGAALLGARG